MRTRPSPQSLSATELTTVLAFHCSHIFSYKVVLIGSLEDPLGLLDPEDSYWMRDSRSADEIGWLMGSRVNRDHASSKEKS